MKFTLHKEDSTIDISSLELNRLLLKKLSSYQEEDYIKHADEFVEQLFLALPSEDVAKYTLQQLLQLFFISGYYYNSFTTKNNVTITTQNSEG